MTRGSAKYRDTITINQPLTATSTPAATLDGMGQVDLSNPANWQALPAQAALGPRSAKVEVGLGEKVYVSQELRSVVSHTVTVRRDSVTTTVTPEMQFIWFGATLNIVDIQDRGPKGREIVFICEEAE